ncbi:MAG: stage II sporulation protein P [Firmicutes bacterium]|nr:stage II sporulation protein P [Bacillota bacterium]
MFRRLRYGLRLLGLRMRRRSYAWTRRLPRAAVRNMGLFYGGLILGALLLTVGRFYPGFYSSLATGAFRGAAALVSSCQQLIIPAMIEISGSDLPKEILKKGLPILELGPEPFDGQDAVRSLVRVVTSFDLADPATFIAAGLPQLQGSGLEELPRIEITLPEKSEPVQEIPAAALPPRQPAPRPREWGSRPLIVVYHTHNSETYHRPGMNPARFNDYHLRNTTDTGIMRVGREFARVMQERYGIPVLHSQRLHDSDGFLRSYINSLDTITRILAENDQVEVVLDFHRDGVANADLTTTINGEEVAQILIVVTTDDYGLPHPNWRRNLAFARFLHERMEEMYPGLSRGVRVVTTARYNLHVHPRALLLEMGNYNHPEELALRSARLLADVFAKVMADLPR